MIKQAEDYNPAEDFNRKLNYVTENYKAPYKPSQSMKPSSIKCMRGAMYQYIGIEPDIAPMSHQLEYICEVGSAIHQHTQHIATRMKSCGWEFVNVGDYIRENKLPLTIVKESNFAKGEYETKLTATINGFKFNFLCDGIVKHDGKYYILEIKSCSDMGFHKQTDVEDKHKDQALSYCTLFNLREVIFVYIERGFMNTKGFLYKTTDEEVAKFISRFKLDYDMIPAKPSEASNKFCQYCQYKSACMDNTVEEYPHKHKYKMVKGVIVYE